MDIITFSVGDMRMGMPLSQASLSTVPARSTLQTDHTGTGTVEATLPVIDLRHKFCFPVPTGEQEVRLITVNLDHKSVGLVINRISEVSILQDVKVETAPGTDHPYITGMVMDQNEPVFLFDWDMVLSSDSRLDLNDLFSKPILDDVVSPASSFLDDILQAADGGEILSVQQIRRLAENHGVPLSTASRLAGFHLQTPVSDA